MDHQPTELLAGRETHAAVSSRPSVAGVERRETEMNDDQGLVERRLSRQDVLKLAAAAGGIGMLGGRASAAEAAL